MITSCLYVEKHLFTSVLNVIFYEDDLGNSFTKDRVLCAVQHDLLSGKVTYGGKYYVEKASILEDLKRSRKNRVRSKTVLGKKGKHGREDELWKRKRRKGLLFDSC